MPNLCGRRLGKYELLERIAFGGMAEVYRAFQPGVERQVVVKILHDHLADSPDFVARFQREARVIGSLHNPHIVRIIDMDFDEEFYYMVMDYIQGPTLGDYLKQNQIMPVNDALRIGVQLANALDYAHSQGVLHRDIKPTNIMFSNDSYQHAVLADFGLARIYDDQHPALTLVGSMTSTPTYMSPEALRGEICDGRSDIYSLGVVLYELFTGKTPYTANTPYSMMTKQATEPLPLPRTLNPRLLVEVEQILLKSLAPEPAARFQSGAELASALDQVMRALHNTALPNAALHNTTLPNAALHNTTLPNADLIMPAPVVSRPKTTKPPESARPANWVTLTLASGGVAFVALATIELLLHI
jgi:serine/threonine-protein kinase